MLFEWDEDKRRSNLAKHGVDFLRATLVFKQTCLEGIDDREDYGEVRQFRIGESDGLLLVVIYVERDENIRIISARKAQPNERKNYYALLYGRD